jgi:hypothetical protein
MIFYPSDPALGPVGTKRTDSAGAVWIKINEYTWVTEANLTLMFTGVGETTAIWLAA